MPATASAVPRECGDRGQHRAHRESMLFVGFGDSRHEAPGRIRRRPSREKRQRPPLRQRNEDRDGYKDTDSQLRGQRAGASPSSGVAKNRKDRFVS